MPFDRDVNESKKTNKKDNKNFWPERLIYAVVITAMGCGMLFKSCDASKDVDVLKEQLKTAAVCCDEVAALQFQVESLKCDTTNMGRQLREKAAQLKKCKSNKTNKSNKTKKKNATRKKVSESSSNVVPVVVPVAPVVETGIRYERKVKVVELKIGKETGNGVTTADIQYYGRSRRSGR